VALLLPAHLSTPPSTTAAGLFLFEIERADGSLLKAVDHDTVLQTGDVLWFAGDLEGVAYLQKYTTLEHMQADQVAKLDSDIIYRRLVQVRQMLHRRVCRHLMQAHHGDQIILDVCTSLMQQHIKGASPGTSFSGTCIRCCP
jgi:uncharacterized transporter YbjL